jgi:hypothetical protein
MQREDTFETSLNPIPGLCLVWIDDQSFKESGKPVKDVMQHLADSGQVKCYKSADKFLRAYWKKHTSHERQARAGQKMIVVCSGEEYDTLSMFMKSITTVRALIKYSDDNAVPTDDDRKLADARRYTCGTVGELVSSIIIASK